jgi:hypothetical protein
MIDIESGVVFLQREAHVRYMSQWVPLSEFVDHMRRLGRTVESSLPMPME